MKNWEWKEAKGLRVIRRLWRDGPLSRWELHERIGATPNEIGAVAARLLSAGVVREGDAGPSTGGRPRVPLEIDATTRNVVGIAFSPNRVDAARLGLRGNSIGAAATRQVADPAKSLPCGRGLLESLMNPSTVAVGVTFPGFLASDRSKVLLSSAFPHLSDLELAPLLDAARGVPVMVENDMYAIAARWMLEHRAEQQEDTLLVSIDDGRLGAAMLINGQPNFGCVSAANELGHTRFPVQTERCFCGQVGCLERIVSSKFLHQDSGGGGGGDRGATLGKAARDYDGNDPALAQLTYLLAMGLANAVNFIRPHRLVLVSPFVRNPAYSDLLVRSIRSMVLEELVDRVRIDLWDEPVEYRGDIAAWLALASLFCEGWENRAIFGGRR